jgi:hypothetical protein
MLFGPEDGEEFRDPDVNRSQPMQARMAGGADGDQEIGIADAGKPVMNMEAVPRPAADAPQPIALEDRFPISGEVIFRVPARPVTLRAQTRDHRDSFAAGAKQWLLLKPGVHRRLREAFLTAGEQ